MNDEKERYMVEVLLLALMFLGAFALDYFFCRGAILGFAYAWITLGMCKTLCEKYYGKEDDIND